MSVCFGPCAQCGQPSTGLLFAFGEPIGPCCDDCGAEYEEESDCADCGGTDCDICDKH